MYVNCFIAAIPVNPCDPSPCGPYSVCQVSTDRAICTCQIGYIGAPPACRPECLISSECPPDKACIEQKCQNPCIGSCGIEARCQVIKHNPICSCPPTFTGDPFVQCIKEGSFNSNKITLILLINIVFFFSLEPKLKPPTTPCIPSPCGPNAECRSVDERAVCSCLPGMLGAPPYCRPECVIDQDCPLQLACVGNKCRNPCTGSCGINAQCTVQNHRPLCVCNNGFEGDPFSGCTPVEGKWIKLNYSTRCTLVF